MNKAKLFALGLGVVIAAISFFTGSTTTLGDAFAIAFDKEKAVAAAAKIINVETVETVPAQPVLVEDAAAVKPVDTTAPAASPTGESVGPQSSLEPVQRHADTRRTAIASSRSFLSGLDTGGGDGDPEPQPAKA